jgi:hypothetical protein
MLYTLSAGIAQWKIRGLQSADIRQLCFEELEVGCKDDSGDDTQIT